MATIYAGSYPSKSDYCLREAAEKCPQRLRTTPPDRLLAPTQRPYDLNINSRLLTFFEVPSSRLSSPIETQIHTAQGTKITTITPLAIAPSPVPPTDMSGQEETLAEKNAKHFE